jgi:hypothetical protein
MLYVALVCSDESCDATYEVCCELEDLDGLTCESCDCVLQAVAFAEVDELIVRPRTELQLREAA